MELVLNGIGEVVFGFLCRLIVIALVAAMLKVKLGSPHPIWGLATIYYYYAHPNADLNALFILGFVAMDFKSAIKVVVVDHLLGGTVEKKKKTVHKIPASKVKWSKT